MISHDIESVLSHIFTEDIKLYYVIDSDHWVDVSYLQVSFQLYIKARDSDPGPTDDDDLDDIFIGHTLQLEANNGFTEMKGFTGIFNRVNFRARFRVTCQQNYYGAHCDTHCVPQNDDRNGHYECNSDGSIRCLEGFENTNNNCSDSKLIMQTMEISYWTGWCHTTIAYF